MKSSGSQHTYCPRISRKVKRYMFLCLVAVTSIAVLVFIGKKNLVHSRLFKNGLFYFDETEYDGGSYKHSHGMRSSREPIWSTKGRQEAEDFRSNAQTKSPQYNVKEMFDGDFKDSEIENEVIMADNKQSNTQNNYYKFAVPDYADVPNVRSMRNEVRDSVGDRGILDKLDTSDADSLWKHLRFESVQNGVEAKAIETDIREGSETDNSDTYKQKQEPAGISNQHFIDNVVGEMKQMKNDVLKDNVNMEGTIDNLSSRSGVINIESVQGAQNKHVAKDMQNTQNTHVAKDMQNTQNTHVAKDMQNTQNTHVAKDMQNTRNTHVAKDMQNTRNTHVAKDMQNTRNTHLAKDMQNTRNTHVAKDMQNTQNTHVAKDMQNTQNTHVAKDMQNTRNTHVAKDMQNTRNTHVAKDMQNTQNTDKAQNTQDIEHTQHTHGIQNVHGTHNKYRTQNAQEKTSNTLDKTSDTKQSDIDNTEANIENGKDATAKERDIKHEESHTPVLLLTYLRSGSTLTADIIQQVPGVFYSYEPIKPYLQSRTEKRQEELGYFTLNGICAISNSSCRQPSQTSEETEVIVADIVRFYSCDLTHFNRAFLWSRNGKAVAQYHICVKTSARLKTRKEMCLKQCFDSTKSIKTIRLSMDIVEILMQKVPNLKVVHLLRDPRGMIQSRKRGGFVKPSMDLTLVARSVCQRFERDIEIAMKLKQKYPGRLKTYLYEQIAEHPKPASESLFNFLGLAAPDNFNLWLHNHTAAGNRSSFYGTSRPNSTVTASAWRLTLPYNEVIKIDSECSKYYKYTGILAVNSTKSLKDLSFHLRAFSPLFGDFY